MNEVITNQEVVYDLCIIGVGIMLLIGVGVGMIFSRFNRIEDIIEDKFPKKT